MKSKPLSASKIKTLQTCSWQYWCKYGPLKLPDTSNDGSKRGSICHLVFEVLGRKGRENLFNNILSKKDVFCEPSIKRLIMKHAIRESVDDDENVLSMKEMILNGLLYDFFGDTHCSPEKHESELAFAIQKDDGEFKYSVRGFIDKLFLYKGEKYALIRDFKSSKKAFNSYEVDDNLQDLMYSLAVKKLFPEYKNRQSEFLFLKFELDPSKKHSKEESSINSGVVKMAAISDYELMGFEHFLTEIQALVDNFTEEDAQENMAHAKGYPKPEEGFAGKIVCGFAKFKGQLKKDGNVMWHCPFKFGFDYFVALDEKGVITKSAHKKEDLSEFKKVEKRKYAGCPAFNLDDDSDLL
tara:strand:+ start:1280 stop:2338 length:1059 start_codon:yes stop_codon:yes gene_type:complete